MHFGPAFNNGKLQSCCIKYRIYIAPILCSAGWNCSLVVLNTGFILVPVFVQLAGYVCEREKWAKLNPDWGWLEHYKSSLSSASQAWRLQQWTVRMSLKHPHSCGSCTGFFFLFFVCGSCTVRATILNCWNSSPSAIYETELLHSGISFSQLLTYSIHH